MSEQFQTEEKFVDVPGGRIYVKLWKPAVAVSSVPIILFHDSLGCVDLWKEFPQTLCQKLGKPIIAYDRLGFGRSDARTDLPSIRFIDEEAEIYFRALVKALDLESFDLFGHSVGGAMAVACAARNHGACRSVVTESTQAFVEDRTLKGISAAAEHFKNPDQINKLKKYHGEKTNWVLKAWVDVWLSSSFASWSLASNLSNVTCELMAIHGDQDEYGSNRFPEMICELSGGKSEMHILPHCGHVPHREQPIKVLELFDRFLNK